LGVSSSLGKQHGEQNGQKIGAIKAKGNNTEKSEFFNKEGSEEKLPGGPRVTRER